MLRGCKRAAACRWRRRIHASRATTTSTRPLSSTPIATAAAAAAAEKRGGEESDWREVGVFWDLENCPVPSSFDPFLVRPNIERALRTSGFLGPISLSGYGNIHGYRAHSLEALSETGVDLHHVPNGGKNSSDRALMIDVLLWTMKHSPPAHILLISGDSDFSVLLHKLRLLNYNVLLASPNNNGISSALVHAASRVWVWPDVATGEGLSGHEHILGTPSLFHKDDMIKNKEATVNKSNLDVHKDIEHVLENMKDPREDVLNGFSKVSAAGWIPPMIVDRVTSIVEKSPGISLGEMSKELKAMSVNPRTLGFVNAYQFLMSIPQLETRFSDGLNVKDRTRYYIARTDDGTPGNASDHVVHLNPAQQDDHVLSCGIVAHNEASDGVAGNEKPALRDAMIREDKVLAKKRSSCQEKRPASSTQQSWVSRLFTLFRGS